MEDEKIIGLYWERNEDAITETSSKYGKLFFRIASNILRMPSGFVTCICAIWSTQVLSLRRTFASCAT